VVEISVTEMLLRLEMVALIASIIVGYTIGYMMFSASSIMGLASFLC
jgi:hypothetical protein